MELPQWLSERLLSREAGSADGAHREDPAPRSGEEGGLYTVDGCGWGRGERKGKIGRAGGGGYEVSHGDAGSDDGAHRRDTAPRSGEDWWWR